ncbi:replication initiator 1-like [Oncorhynchus masou masou]|uniref:replication initiator 1-like n=1 Tax=Oncorhynchus masou masou TaxID=90313 RepID=UPI003182E6BD
MKTHRDGNPSLLSAGGLGPSTSRGPENHQENHTAATSAAQENFNCPDRPSAQKHMTSQDSGEKASFFCSLCGEQFSEKAQLEEHRLAHNNKKPFPCPDCGKRFRSNYYVKIHMRMHTGRGLTNALSVGRASSQKKG